ncbi:LAMI_0F10352g1_1 [Lachancea mirantina]|uniref:LAMI_0F10352g1_1 n=1 Tax=Lachancea mirantina TaxID=1230905 RepID=A0A1G4K1Z8_9SACH|nr:LAMI_0F10352g1_1 [Lachancea mirantina]
MAEPTEHAERAERANSVDSRSSERRRSKVSRACDQCRSKKTRCDYSDEKAICTTCLRSGKQCTFERVPLKRGPIKGYKGQGDDVESSAPSSRRSSRKRSNSESWPSKTHGAGVGAATGATAAALALPPLAHYLPQSYAGARTHTLVGLEPQQQQFWKVPYHEYQYDRRSSVGSVGSDLHVQQPRDRTPSSISTSSTVFRGSQRVPSDAGNDNGSVDGSRKSPSEPAILRHPSASPSQHQYPYSQFVLAQQQPAQALQPPEGPVGPVGPVGQPPTAQHFRHFENGFHSRKSSDVSDALSPNFSAVSHSGPQPVFLSTGEGDKNSPEASSSAKIRTPKIHENIEKRSKRQSEQKSQGDSLYSLGKASSESPFGSIAYGQIPHIQLIDIYYEFVHPNFPVIPINKRTLTDDLLLFNTQPISGIHELNNFVLHWFRNSLELLIRVALKRPVSNNGLRIDPLTSQMGFIASLRECFQQIVDAQPRLRGNEQLISPKIKFIYLSAFTILNYILALVGFENSYVLGMSVTIYNEFKIHRYFLFAGILSERGDSCEVQENGTTADKESRHTSNPNETVPKEGRFYLLYKRLYALLAIVDSLQSCCFGVPKLISVPLTGITADAFKHTDDSWSVDSDPARVELILKNLKLGETLSELAMNRETMSGDHAPRAAPPDLELSPSDNDIPSMFMQTLYRKKRLQLLLFELVDSEGNFSTLTSEIATKLVDHVCSLISCIRIILTLILKTNPTNGIDFSARPHITSPDIEQHHAPDPQPAEENLDIYKKLLGLNESQDNSISRGTVSPYLAAIYLELTNILEHLKHMPTSLIALVMSANSGETPVVPHAQQQDVIMTLSNSMNDVVQITSLINVLQPLKMLERVSPTEKQYSQSIMKLKMAPLELVKSPLDKTLHNFVDLAWKLLDDDELGWA